MNPVLVERPRTLFEAHAKLQNRNITLQFTHLVHNVPILGRIKFSTHDNTPYIRGNNPARHVRNSRHDFRNLSNYIKPTTRSLSYRYHCYEIYTGKVRTSNVWTNLTLE
jgi:hypothetical protein